jgi:hypothetical protein
VSTASEYRYLRREFYWRWPADGMAWFFWAHQNYSSNWIIWRVGPLNYQVEVAQPGECSYRVVRRPSQQDREGA